MPTLIATGVLDHNPLRIEANIVITAVAVMRASYGMPETLNIYALTGTIYNIAINVVKPAATSVFTSV
jgi:hypothetical protein